MSNVIDSIKIKLIERCQLTIYISDYIQQLTIFIDHIQMTIQTIYSISDYIQQGDPTYFADEGKIIYWKRAISKSEQLVLLTKVQQEKD